MVEIGLCKGCFGFMGMALNGLCIAWNLPLGHIIVMYVMWSWYCNLVEHETCCKNDWNLNVFFGWKENELDVCGTWIKWLMFGNRNVD